MQRLRKVIVFLIAIVVLLSQFDNKNTLASNSSKFEIKNGVLIKYNGKDNMVTIPSTVKTIGPNAFMNCDMTEVTIPNSVKTIGQYSFGQCIHLEKIIVPDSVTTIADYAFKDCYKLKKVTLGSSVESIGIEAFVDTMLNEINIPKSVNMIGHKAFKGTPWLEKKQKKNPLVILNNVVVNGRKCKGDVIIPEYVNYICPLAFFGNKEITKVKIPESVETIEKMCFTGCWELTSVDLPENLTRIDFSAFSGCVKLKDIDVGEKVTYIGNDAFDSTIWLSNKRWENHYVVVNNILVSCGIEEKGYTPIPPEVEIIAPGAFTFSDIEQSIIPETVKEIGYTAYSNCEKLKEVVIPKSVTVLEGETFDDCTSLTNITIPETVTKFYPHIFDDTPWLEAKRKENPLVIINGVLIDAEVAKGKIKIPDTVNKIACAAFETNDFITEITIPDSVKEIEYNAFSYCKNLTKLTIPKSVKKIDEEAIYQRFGDKEIVIYCDKNSEALRFAKKCGFKYKIR